jgi:hypothetical protein
MQQLTVPPLSIADPHGQNVHTPFRSDDWD